MASELSNAPLNSETPSKSDVESTKPFQPGSSQENGQPKPTGDISSTSEAEVSENSNPPEPNPTEDSKPSEEDSLPTNGASHTRGSEDKLVQPSVGDKREHDSAAPSTDSDKSNTDGAVEPSPKKQKTSESHSDVNGTSPTVTAEDEKPSQPPVDGKKKGGRPKKTKEAPKRDIPSNGIGSRTRSRTKVAS